MSAAPMPWEEAAQQQMPWEEAKASGIKPLAPNAGLTPPAGGPNSPTNPIRQDIERNKYAATAGLPGGLPAPANDTMTALGGLGIGAAATAVAGPSVLRVAAQHPVIAQTVGSALISQARHLPVVGKFIPPYSEMLPYLIGGKGKTGEGTAGEEPATPTAEEGPRFPSGNMRAQEGEYVETPTAPPSGPPIARSEVVRPLGLPASATAARDLPYRRGPGEVAAEDLNPPDPNVLGGRQGIRIAQPVAPGPQLALPAPTPQANSVAFPRTQPIAATPSGAGIAPEITRVPSTNEIRTSISRPQPGSHEDLLEDRGIQQENRDWLEEQGRRADSEARRRAIAGSSTGITKGDLVNRARIAAPTASAGTPLETPAEPDLVPILRQSVELAKKGKAARIAKSSD